MYEILNSTANKLKYGTAVADEKYKLCKQFVAWCCNGCSVAPLTDYANNSIYQ